MEPADIRSQVRPLERLLSVRELAEYLGVPVTTLYTWCHRDEGPPGFRVGRHIRYRRRDVENWVNSQLNNPGS